MAGEQSAELRPEILAAMEPLAKDMAEAMMDGLGPVIGAMVDAALASRTAAVAAERDKLKEFKAYVHKRLDEAGVPAEVPGKHLDGGCRIGGRLDWVLAWVSDKVIPQSPAAMSQTNHLLVTLAEECCEVAQRVCKALRFGLGEEQPGQKLTNAQRINAEVIDLMAVLEMLHAAGALPKVSPKGVFPLIAQTDAKKDKVEKYLRFAAGRGLVSDMPAEPVPHPQTEAGGECR